VSVIAESLLREVLEYERPDLSDREAGSLIAEFLERIRNFGRQARAVLP
jgi:hypothetical protein